MAAWSASFREDEVRGANEADHVLGPVFVVGLVGYCVGFYGMGLPWPLAFIGVVPTLAVLRVWSRLWRRHAVPFLDRRGW